MSLDPEKKKLLFQAFMSSKNKRQTDPTQINFQQFPQPVEQQLSYENFRKTVSKKNPSRSKRITPSYVNVGEERDRNSDGTESLRRVAESLSENARLFAENMAELIAQKFSNKVYNRENEEN